MASPWNGEPQWMLQIVALTIFAVLLTRCNSRLHAALLGWVFSSSWLAAVFWWLYISMHTYAGLSAFLSVLAVACLAGVLALYYALTCFVFMSFKGLDAQQRALLFGALWMSAEMARGLFFTGFPWGASGYAHAESPLAVLLPWIGVYGLCGVLGWLAMTLAQLKADPPRAWIPPLTFSALVALMLQFSVGFSTPTGSLSVALLQGNIAQDEKFQPGSGVPAALAWYAEQLGKNHSELVVAPETAIPLLPQQLPAGFMDALIERYSKGNQAAMIGLPIGSLTSGYTNAIVGLKPGQTEIWTYNKHHLVPFGEFIPLFFRWFTSMMDIPLSDFQAGDVGQSSFEWQGQRLAGNICYEDLFGEELSSRFKDSERSPTIFVNASNIAWFGNSLAIDQHLAISRIRALELERPFVRATNTGATAIIDHQGRVTSELPRHTQGVLLGEVQGRSGLTPYARWASLYGLWPLWIVAIGLIFCARRWSHERPLQNKAS